MVAVVVISHRSDRVALLHTFLYHLLCPNASAYQCGRQRSAVDNIFRTGQDIPIWRLDDTGCGGIQSLEELDETRQRPIDDLGISMGMMPN